MIVNDATGVSASALMLAATPCGYFDGMLDDVRIYDRTLTEDEILLLSNLYTCRC